MHFFELDPAGNMNDAELCRLEGPPKGVGLRNYCMTLGDRVMQYYPQEPKIFLKEKHPGIKLSSLLGNTDTYLIVCSEMKDVIASRTRDIEIEYLPFDLYDHRKRLYSRDYFIINPIGTWDCLDPEASGVEYGSEGGVIYVDRYAIDPKKATSLPHLFRVREWPSTYILSEALVSDIKEKGFTNIVLTPLPFSGES